MRRIYRESEAYEAPGSDSTRGTNRGGRPRLQIDGTDVLSRRDKGQSWRQIAKELKIGTATAMRLYSLHTVPKPSQNSEVSL